MVEPLKDLDQYIIYPGKTVENFSNPKAEAIYKESIADPAAFWSNKAE